METYFAPADRANAPQLAAQIRMIAGSQWYILHLHSALVVTEFV